MAVAREIHPFHPHVLWPLMQPTELLELPALASQTGVARVFAKLECQRPYGNFKALGGACAGLKALARHAQVNSLSELRKLGSALPILLCASAGNHGLAVAAAARAVGGTARIYLSVDASSARVARLVEMGAIPIRVEGTYDDAVYMARAAALAGEGLLVADVSEDEHDCVVADVMNGYALIADELRVQFGNRSSESPTHAFIQAGVGGLAAAMAEGLAGTWRGPGCLVTVEPQSAACVARALESGRPVKVDGILTTEASMLACGLASASAVAILRAHGARGMTVAEQEINAAAAAMPAAGGPGTTASGATGLAGFLHAAESPTLRASFALNSESSVLLLVTEGANPAIEVQGSGG